MTADAHRELTLAHVSDTHLGYAAYHDKRTPAGNNVRTVDMARAFMSAVEAISELDPPVVLHTGDLCEKPTSWRDVDTWKIIESGLQRLCEVRPDGSRRQLVLIAGNHDIPARRDERCYLETFESVPGIHVVIDSPRTVDFAALSSEDPSVPVELASVVVTAVPHDSLKDLADDGAFGTVRPVPGRLNVLASHGVVGGSELYRRIGREYHLPSDVVTRDWQYVAMGHWHRSGPVRPTSGSRDVVWYAGSTENTGFGDFSEESRKGWLEVAVGRGLSEPEVTFHQTDHRRMMRLAPVDAASLSAERLQEVLDGALAAADVRGAIVGQVVSNVSAETMSLVDKRMLDARAEAGGAMHYHLDPRRPRSASEPSGSDAGETSVSDETRAGDRAALERLLESQAGTELADDDRADRIVAAAKKALRAAWDASEDRRRTAVPAEGMDAAGSLGGEPEAAQRTVRVPPAPPRDEESILDSDGPIPVIPADRLPGAPAPQERSHSTALDVEIPDVSQKDPLT